MPRLTRSERLFRQRLGANVRRLRAEQALSVQVVADRAGMNWRHWQKVEAGDTNATLQTLVRIGDALGVDPAVLLAETAEATAK